MKYVFITFNKPLKLLPHDPEAPIQDEPNEPQYNNSVVQAWYNYNLAKTTRASWNEDWYKFLSRMCDYNNVQVDSIPPEIFWGQDIWNPQHPLSNQLSQRLFAFVERNEYPPDNGLQSSYSDAPFVHPATGPRPLDSEEHPNTD